jgi:uncharacterized membrane protein YphA (DoxX/SURF4 family)
MASVFRFNGAGKLANVAGCAEITGLPCSIAAIVVYVEPAAGLDILLGGLRRGLVTRLSSLAMIPVLNGAVAHVHRPRRSFGPAEGFPIGAMELQVVLLPGPCLSWPRATAARVARPDDADARAPARARRRRDTSDGDPGPPANPTC